MHELNMSPDEALNSSPLRTSKRIKLLRDAKDPESNKKESEWSRKELLAAKRLFNDY